jgi:hypothetical protein
MLAFKDRLVTVFCNSPLHDEEVAVVELVTTKPSYEGAICLKAIVEFAVLVCVNTSSLFVREQNRDTIELWLFAPRDRLDFDSDPTDVYKNGDPTLIDHVV